MPVGIDMLTDVDGDACGWCFRPVSFIVPLDLVSLHFAAMRRTRTETPRAPALQELTGVKFARFYYTALMILNRTESQTAITTVHHHR